MEPLQCDACRVVMPWTNHSFSLPFESIESIRNTSESCGYCMTAIQDTHRSDFLWTFDHRGRGGVVGPLRYGASRVVMP